MGSIINKASENKHRNKTLLIVSGGIEAVPGIITAKKMGLYVVVSDKDPKAPGFLYADAKIIASTYEVGETVKAATLFNNTVRSLDGVMCVAADVPHVVASVAKELELPGIPLQSAQLATDKLAMKEKFAEDCIPIPWFKQVNSTDHLFELTKIRGYPLVLKPVDSRGSRGVLLLTDKVDLAWAFSESQKHSPSNRVMVEEFLDGPQISTESIVLDGQAYTPGFADRNYELLKRYAPNIIENGGELPSFLSQCVQTSVAELVNNAARSMGITNGVVKGDIVVNKDKAYVIELAARLSGGYFCTHEIPLNTGVDFVKQAILLALGEKPDPDELKPKFQKGVAQRYLFPKPGRVVNISGVEEVSGRQEIALCEIRVQVGDIIKPIQNHPGRAGVVIATGKNREEAKQAAIDAVNTIKISTTSE